MSADDVGAYLVRHRRMLAAAQTDGGEASWERVLATPSFWEVRHDTAYSVIHMSDQEIREAIVQDLVFARIEAIRGALGAYPRQQMFRHLGALTSDLVPVVNNAFKVVSEEGLVSAVDGRLIIPEGKFEEAQDYCGYFLLDPVGEDDVMDGIVQAGGTELLGDVIGDVAESISTSPNSPKL